MKKKLLIFCILSAFFCTGCSTVKEVFVSEEEMISSVAELHETVENALKKGQTEIHFVTETLGQADLVNLNEEHDGFYGSVRQYEMKTVQWLDRSYITLQCEISDNYYVENAILYGGEIPTERVQAQELKKSCEKILKKIDAEASDYKKEKKIHDYLVRNVAYGYPEGREQKDSTGYLAYGALVEGKAVCNGYAQAMKLLCDLTGVECQMIAGQADGENHAWNLVRLGEKWYHADVTWDDPEPDEKDRMLYSYFNLHDEEMALTHQWNAAEYVAAEGRKYQYYRKMICTVKTWKSSEKHVRRFLQKKIRSPYRYWWKTMTKTDIMRKTCSLFSATAVQNPFICRRLEKRLIQFCILLCAIKEGSIGENQDEQKGLKFNGKFF